MLVFGSLFVMPMKVPFCNYFEMPIRCHFVTFCNAIWCHFVANL